MIKRHDVDQDLPGLLEQMQSSGETITARTVASKLGVSPSTITRDQRRVRLLSSFQVRQKELLALREKTDPLSRTRLVRRIKLRDAEIAILKRYVQLLTAANKAMLIAVGEMGGTIALQKFFNDYESIRAEIRVLDASLVDLTAEAHSSQLSLGFDANVENC